MTVRLWALSWLAEFPREKYSTRTAYREGVMALCRHSHPLLTTNIADVSIGQAFAYCNAHPSRYPLLRMMFADALRAGRVFFNPFADLRIERGPGRKYILPLEPREVEKLADAAGVRSGRFRGMIYFAAYTGVRPGELFAVRWTDLHVVSEEVTIARRIYRGHYDVPKSGVPRRIIIPPTARDAMPWEEQKDGNELIFPAPCGQPFTASSFGYWWRKIRTLWEATIPQGRLDTLAIARGKPHLDFYELRHFCASHFMDRNATPEDIALQMGHTDGGRLVRELYGHPDQEKARDRLRDALDGYVEEYIDPAIERLRPDPPLPPKPFTIEMLSWD